MQNEAPQISDLSIYIGNILEALVPLIGFIAFTMIVVGGFKILTSSGNAESMEKGKKTITMAILGLALTIISWLILVLINHITGAKVLDFSLMIN